MIILGRHKFRSLIYSYLREQEKSEKVAFGTLKFKK